MSGFHVDGRLMQFLAYITVVLVSLGGILVELDWLTKPKLDTKSPVQVASTAVPIRAAPKVDGPNEGPSPVATKKADADAQQANAPVADKAAETTGAASAVQASTAVPLTPIPFPSVAEAKADTKAETKADPALQPSTQSSPPPPAQAAAASSAPQPQPQTQPVPVAAKATNSCDVQGCASAYQSFRASDCTYQPMEGPRKVCEKAPAASQRAGAASRDPAVRKPGRDAELRDVERAVRRITTGDDADFRPARSQVIVIEQPGRDW